MPTTVKVPLVGQTMENGREAVVATAVEGQPAWLAPQPANPHDPNAIAVILNGRQAGYIPAPVAARIRLTAPIEAAIASVRVFQGVVRGFDIAVPKDLLNGRNLQPA